MLTVNDLTLEMVTDAAEALTLLAPEPIGYDDVDVWALSGTERRAWERSKLSISRLSGLLDEIGAERLVHSIEVAGVVTEDIYPGNAVTPVGLYFYNNRVITPAEAEELLG